MRAGKLDQLLDILAPVDEVNASGQRRAAYESRGHVSAQMVHAKGFRKVEASENFPDHTATFYVRDLVQVGENWRVQHVGGFLYTVNAVETIRRKGLKILECSRVNK